MSRELEFSSATDLYTQYDQSWQTGSLRSSLHEKQMEVRRSLKTLGGQVETMEAAFSRVPNSPPCDYFQDRLANLRYESNIEVTHRIKLQVIEEWFSTHHEKSRRILIADGHTIFGDIQDLHRDLKKFTDKITRFNTALQNHLSHSSKVFDSIKDLQVSIFSAVEDLDYWTVISKISTARDEWMRPDELPDDESVENLRLLLQNWDIKSGIQADFKSLVSIRGSVREKGNLRYFKNKADLENISSNGLSYLILIILFLGFISKVRGQAPVQLTWCVDELKAIDADNVISLCNYLGQNFITLCTAFPDPDAETLILFENKYKLDSERRLVHCELAVDEGLDEDEEYELELEGV
ncbi:ATP-binding protein [Pseudomonas sp. MWU13-2100]|uniref:ATP-binding protein n=1 Tax=Pseudomonas sp. MWU13-2100 TaxID=2935075 RepID=UPI00200C26A2|nr:ATP-binding protein [Pseudomonas sp. MWU13-2100]